MATKPPTSISFMGTPISICLAAWWSSSTTLKIPWPPAASESKSSTCGAALEVPKSAGPSAK